MGELKESDSSSNAVANAGKAVAEALEQAAELFGFSILLKQKKMFRGVHGQLNPSLWKYYHRHGYWATRRKKLDFGIKRKYRYHQVEGDGKKSASYVFRYCQH